MSFYSGQSFITEPVTQKQEVENFNAPFPLSPFLSLPLFPFPPSLLPTPSLSPFFFPSSLLLCLPPSFPLPPLSPPFLCLPRTSKVIVYSTKLG